MKKVFLAAMLIVGVVASQFVAMSQASAQEVYLGKDEYGEEDCYLLTETVNYKAVNGKELDLSCTVRHGKRYLGYSFTFQSDGYVIYSINYPDGTVRNAGIFEATEPPSPSRAIAYKAFLVILKMYGLIR